MRVQYVVSRTAVALSLVLLAGCDQNPKQLLAQCTIDSYSDAGRHFLKEGGSDLDRDKAYRNWMLLCMEAKGFSYDAEQCPPTDSGVRSSEKECYKKM